MRARARARRQRSIRPWSPDRSTSGTSQPRKLGRASELGILEQTADEALVVDGLIVAEHPGQQAGHRLHHHQCGQLAAGEHEVPHRELLVGQVVGHPLVDALVAPTEQREPPGIAGQALGHLLVEPPAGGREQDERPRQAPRDAATASTEPNTGSGASTMPGPPPKGASSTDRWGSVAAFRRSWARRSSRPAACGPPEDGGRRRSPR